MLVENVLAVEHRHRTGIPWHAADNITLGDLGPRAFGELRLVRVCPLADIAERVDLAEALEELEFDMDDVGQAAARLQARTDRLILRGALAGIHEFDLDARMRGVEHVDLRLEIRQPRPQKQLDGIGSANCRRQGRYRNARTRNFQEVTTLHRPPKRIEILRH